MKDSKSPSRASLAHTLASGNFESMFDTTGIAAQCAGHIHQTGNGLLHGMMDGRPVVASSTEISAFNDASRETLNLFETLCKRREEIHVRHPHQGADESSFVALQDMRRFAALLSEAAAADPQEAGDLMWDAAFDMATHDHAHAFFKYLSSRIAEREIH